LSQHNNPRLTKNNFDLLRLLFAGTVCLVHAHDLSGFQQLRPIADVLSSAVAVKAFFVVSGFLIFMSFERSSSLASYVSKRVRRIYPAYFTVVMLCAAGLAAVSTKNIGDYFSYAWLKYVLANLAFLNFLQPTLPGVFDSNKLPTVNGALWTLKIEAMFYLAVPVFVFLFRRFSRLGMLALVYCLSVAYAGLLALAAQRTGSAIYAELGRQLPGQLSYFMAGAFLYYFLPLFERRVGYFLAAAVAVLLANMLFPLPILEPFALATVVVFFGLFLYLGNFGKYGDFSYGVYILHFPVIQLLLHSGWFREKPWYFLTAVILATTGGAIAMWHLVEKRFLFRSSHYIATSSSAPGMPPGLAAGTGAKLPPN
jgi:peptidoglycan/LPS O-acetylase OafA/YrhL